MDGWLTTLSSVPICGMSNTFLLCSVTWLGSMMPLLFPLFHLPEEWKLTIQWEFCFPKQITQNLTLSYALCVKLFLLLILGHHTILVLLLNFWLPFCWLLSILSHVKNWGAILGDLLTLSKTGKCYGISNGDIFQVNGWCQTPLFLHLDTNPRQFYSEILLDSASLHPLSL